MKPLKLLISASLALFAFSQGAGAIDANDQSPYDKHPECLDRNVDSSTGNCVIKDEGTPRHYYPPRTAVTPSTPTTPATPAAPVVPTAPATQQRAPSAVRRGI